MNMNRKLAFAIQNIPAGKLNAMVKNLMLQMGITDPEETVRRINSREWTAGKSVSRVTEKDGLFHVTLPRASRSGEDSFDCLVLMRELEINQRILETQERRYNEGFPSSYEEDHKSRRDFVIIPGNKFRQSGNSMVGVNNFQTSEGRGPAVVSSVLLDETKITNDGVYAYARSLGLEPCIHRDAGLLMEHLISPDWESMGLNEIRVMHDHKPVNLIHDHFLKASSPKPDGPERLVPEILKLWTGGITTTHLRGDNLPYNAIELNRLGFVFYKPV